MLYPPFLWDIPSVCKHPVVHRGQRRMKIVRRRIKATANVVQLISREISHQIRWELACSTVAVAVVVAAGRRSRGKRPLCWPETLIPFICGTGSMSVSPRLFIHEIASHTGTNCLYIYRTSATFQESGMQ